MILTTNHTLWTIRTRSFYFFSHADNAPGGVQLVKPRR